MNSEDFTLTRTVPPEVPKDEVIRHTPFRVIPGGKDSPTSGLQPGAQEHRLEKTSERNQQDFRIIPIVPPEVGHRTPKADRYTLHRGDFELQNAGRQDRRDFAMREQAVVPRDARRLPQRDEKARTGVSDRIGPADMMHVSLTSTQRVEEIRGARKRAVTHPSTAEIEKRDAAIIEQLRKSLEEAGIVPVAKLDRDVVSPAVRQHQQGVEIITEGAKGRATYKEQPAPIAKKKEYSAEEIKAIEKSRAESDEKLIKAGAEKVQAVDADGKPIEVLRVTDDQIDSARKEMQNNLDNKALIEETGKVLSAMDKKEVESIRDSLNEMGMLGSDHQIAYIKKMLDREQKVSGRTLSHEEAIKIMREGIADPSFPKAADYLENLFEAAKAKPEHHAPKPQYTQEQIKKLNESRAESDQELLKGGAEMKDGVLHATEEQITEAHKEMESDEDYLIKEYARNVQKQLEAIGEENLTRIRKTLKTEGMLGTDAQSVFVHRILDWYQKTSNRSIPVEEAIQIMREGVADPSRPKEAEYQKIIAEAAKARQEMRDSFPPKEPPKKPDEKPDEKDTDKKYFEHQMDREHPDDEIISPEDRIANQQRYIESIARRYTVDNLRHLVEETRTGETVRDYQTRKREAIRLQSFLYSLNREPRDYIAELEEVNTSLKPMSSETRLSILIPAYNESTRIERTLETWTTQQLKEDGTPINPHEIEIVVLVNRPNTSKSFDNTREVIDAFRKKHPEFADSIQVIEKTFNFESVTKKVGAQDREFPDVRMGTIYRYLTDLAILRNTRRLSEGASEEVVAQHVMRTGGADVYKRSPYHVAHILNSFTDTEIEQYVSLSDYSPEVYEKLPLLFLAKQLQENMNEDLTHGLSHIGLGTYRAALYAEAGGFEHSMKVAEEMELSKRVRRVLQKRGGSMEQYRRRDLVLNALDDPRRDIATLYQGRAITRAYEDYQENQSIRSMDIAEILAGDIPDRAQLTTDNLSVQADGIFKLYLDLYYDPENGVGEPQSTQETIESFLSAFHTLGIQRDAVHIIYGGKPFDLKTFTDEVTSSAAPINEIRKKFRVEISELPDEEQIHGLIEQQYEDVHGEWVFDNSSERPNEEDDEETPQRKKQNKVIGWVKNIAGNAMSRVRKQKEPAVDQQEAEAAVGDTSKAQSQAGALPEKTPAPTINYDQTVSQFVTQNQIDLRGPELRRFTTYVQTNNRTDLAQAYDDFLRENAPKRKPEVQEPAVEATGNPLAEAAMGMAALAENTTVRVKPVEGNGEVTADMTAILQAGQQNNAEPWYGDFVQNTKALSQMRAPGFLRSFSREQVAQFDRIMLASLDQMSDIPAYQSNSEELLKTASRNKALADAICERKSPARKLLAQKFEDFIRDDTHAMHYMHQYEHTISQNPLSLFSVTNRDGSFYKGLLAATLRNKELHQTDLANILGIPEVRDLLKQAVYGFEVRTAEGMTGK